MVVGANTEASAFAVSVNNTQFQPSTDVVPQKIILLGSPTTTVPEAVPKRIADGVEAGNLYGRGSMLAHLAEWALRGSNGIPMYAIPQAEPGGAAASTGDIDFTGTTGVLADTIPFYVAGVSVPVTVVAGDDDEAIATKLVAAVTADPDLLVSAEVNGVTAAQVDFTAKSKGPFGDEITLRFGINSEDEVPSWLTQVTTAMSGGSGVPVVANALNALGLNDDANEDFYTVVVNGYGQDSTTLNSIRDYVGLGNEAIALYKNTVHKPFRAVTGDTTHSTDSTALDALIVIGDARDTDRSGGIIPAPDSPHHPAAVAAVTGGIMARVANKLPEQNYRGIPLPGINGGSSVNRWTNDHTNRDLAVKAGIGTTRVEASTVYLQDVITFYHPGSVAASSNGYKSMRNIAILQNILTAVFDNFRSEKWQGASVSTDVADITSFESRQKAFDITGVREDMFTLARAMAGRNWITDLPFTLAALSEPGAIAIRSLSNGFNISLKIKLPGEVNVVVTTIDFDINLT